MPNITGAGTPPLDVVVCCPDDFADLYRTPLQLTCRVAATSSAETAMRYMSRTSADLLIVDGDRDDVGSSLCQQARAVRPAPPLVLVTMSNPAGAGQVIDRCDSVLLKPFAPNLLVSRVGRLLRPHNRELRERASKLLERAHLHRAKSEHLKDRSGTLREWPSEHCPYCSHTGVVLFDYSSIRRAWYACGECRKVWLAKRLE
jgi:DNA-binding response OmpR family regulator